MVSQKHSQGVEFACPNKNCIKTFRWKGNLRRHLRYECNVKPRFKCPYCLHKSNLSSNVYKHVRKFHPKCEVFAVDVIICKLQP